jgi:septum site-determining protein MinD
MDSYNFRKRRCRTRQAVVKDKTFEDLYLLPTAHTRNNISIDPEQIKKLCIELKETYEFVLIDCPSGIDKGFENAITCAEEAIIVSTPDIA